MAFGTSCFSGNFDCLNAHPYGGHVTEENHRNRIWAGIWISTLVLTLTFLHPAEASVSSLDSPAGVTPDPNYALQFDGVDDFVRVLDIGNFDFDTTFTVELWYKPESVTG